MKPPGPDRLEKRSLTSPAHSVVIVLYLSRKYQIRGHWYPSELQAHTCVDEYLVWKHVTIQLPAINVYLCKPSLSCPTSPDSLQMLHSWSGCWGG
ncbi:glutathione S-transferase theta-1-like [Pan paniscus]|uniref:glutathione S-transferase theta-1-like n=1 Tax=Pan paniscus TaxID=9597 RepID=UPI002436F703|nr:glutathione S-transferase theta-1-like [Pan paniscus]